MQKVLELDSGRAKELPLHENIAVEKIEEDAIKDLEEYATSAKMGQFKDYEL